MQHLVFTVGTFTNYRNPEKRLDGEQMFTALVTDVSGAETKTLRSVEVFTIQALAENILTRVEEAKTSEWQMTNSPKREKPDALQPINEEEYKKLSALLK